MGMKPKIYVETSVISYLTARASRDFATVARQEFSRQWWDRRGETYQVSISTLVLQEISKGDVNAASRRLAVCEGLDCLRVDRRAIELARRLLADGMIPKTEAEDALHIALATTSRMDYIASWNFAHLVGPGPKFRLQTHLAKLGFARPLLATPEELLEVL